MPGDSLSAPASASETEAIPVVRYSAAQRPIWLLVLALVVAVSIFGAIRTVRLVQAVTLLNTIDEHPQPRVLRAYMRFFSYTVAQHDITIPGEYGPVSARLYTPIHRVDPPTIVFVHGMTRAGYHDGLAERLAYRMAANGYQVLTPDEPDERRSRMTHDALHAIGDAAHWAAQRSRGPVSLLGASFSGGLVVATAAQPQYARDVKMVLSIGGYDDIDRLARYYMHEGEPEPDGKMSSSSVQPSPFGLLLLAVQHMDEMVPPGDVAPIQQAAIDVLSRDSAAAQRDFAQLTPEQQSRFKDLQDIQAPQTRELLDHMLERHHSELASISPHGHMGTLTAKLFLLHGRDDATIPAGESAWMAQEAPTVAATQLLISSDMLHVVMTTQAGQFRRLRLAAFLESALSLARRR